MIRRAACDIVAGEAAHVFAVDTAPQAVESLQGLDSRVTRVRAVIDAATGTNVEMAVSELRAASGDRHFEAIALLPPDADVAPLPGVNRTLVKPLCTPDLVAPLATADAAQSMSVRALPMRGSRGRALVVEDNLVNQEMARTMLDMMGFEVTTASNGQEGVFAATADPDLAIILMDCQMPVMDGLAATRAIRAAETGGKRVPIVALTGNAMPGDREACMAAGMDDYLAKPFSLTALRNTLDKWTGGAQAQQPRERAQK